MKNILLSALLLVIVLSVSLFAQPHKGNVVLGGTINYSNNKNQTYPSDPNYSMNETSSQLTLSPSLGIFATDQFMYGLALGYTENKTEYKSSSNYSSDNNTSNLYFISPFIRNYNYFNDIVGMFTELSFSYGSGEIESTNNQIYDPYKSKFDITIYSITLRPGVSVNLGNRFLLEASIGLLGYSSTTYHHTSPASIKVDDTKNSTFGFSLNLNSLDLGVQVLF